MRWLRWGIGTFIIVVLLGVARQEAVKRGRKGLSAALPLVGAAILSFLLSITVQRAALSNFLMALSVLCIAAAIGLWLWLGFR